MLPLEQDGREVAYQKWCRLAEADRQLSIINNGIYGGSFTDSTMNITLLRTPMYSAHPVEERQITPHNRYLKHLDMGERIFNIRITPEADIEPLANTYNEKPVVISFFPCGQGEKTGSMYEIDNKNIVLSSIKPYKDGYSLHLFNSSEANEAATVDITGLGVKCNINFKPFELKFMYADKNGIKETEFEV